MKYIFSGHNKFDCKVDWLSKYLIYDKDLKVDDETIMNLGLGANMIKSLNYWIKVFEIEKLKYFLKKDIFFEKLESLYLLHYNLVKNASLYFLFFNKMSFYKFTKEDIFNFLNDFIVKNSLKVSLNTLKADIDVFIRIYNDLFKELDFIKKHNDFYKLKIKNKDEINDKLFLYFLADFIEMHKFDVSFSISTIANGKFSLQKTLLMSENIFLDKLQRLKEISNGIFEYNESAVLREVYIKKNFKKEEFLEDIYNEV